MNKLTLSLLLSCIFLIPNTIFAQDYCPFDFENGLWEANYYLAGGPDNIARQEYNEYTIGDTLVNDSLLCYKLTRTGMDCGLLTNYYDPINCFENEIFEPFSQYLGIICEQNKRIYYDFSDDLSDSLYLVYDFNVEIGDTIDHWWGIYTNWGPPITTIADIDSVEMCGKIRKRFLTNYYFEGIQIYFIEGIGSNAGLIPSYEYFESGSNLVCYSDENCAPCTFVTDVKEASEPKAKIYPNPFKENIFIDTEITNYRITIFNQNGQVIKTFENESNLDLAELPSGVYFLGIHSDDNIYYEKIVKYE